MTRGRLKRWRVVLAALVIGLWTPLLACRDRPSIADDTGSSTGPLDAPVARALRERDPAAFDALAYHVAQFATTDTAEQSIRIQSYLRTHVVPAYIPRADDAALREYMTAMIEGLQELRDRSYHRCYTFLFGDWTLESERLALEASLSARTRDTTLSAIARLIDSAGPMPVAMDASRVRVLLEHTVIPGLQPRYGERLMVLRDEVSRDIDRVAACDTTLDIYKAAVDLSPPDGGLLIRHLLTNPRMPVVAASFSDGSSP